MAGKSRSLRKKSKQLTQPHTHTHTVFQWFFLIIKRSCTSWIIIKLWLGSNLPQGAWNVKFLPLSGREKSERSHQHRWNAEGPAPSGVQTVQLCDAHGKKVEILRNPRDKTFKSGYMTLEYRSLSLSASSCEKDGELVGVLLWQKRLPLHRAGTCRFGESCCKHTYMQMQ